MAEGDEWTLAAGDWRCTVSPLGASLRRLWLEPHPGASRDVLWGYTGSTNKKGGQGDVLAPWPNRIRAGRYIFADRWHQLPLNDKQGPNAIHGFLRSRTWDGERSQTRASFRTVISCNDHPGYPFDVEVGVAYELLSTGLVCAFVARNLGGHPAPFAIGFHPYILGPVKDMVVEVPAQQVQELQDLLPTGRHIPVRDAGVLPSPLGDIALNHCLTELTRDKQGFARLRANDVVLWMDRAFTHVVLYTGDALGADARGALAIEPMTCGVDAFNQGGTGQLASGQVTSGSWGITLA